MSDTISANVTKMFETHEPCCVSGSQAELGMDAGKYTWNNAKEIARNHEEWLLSDLEEACEAMRDWAKSTGAWDDEEIEDWSDEELLALFAQNVASEIRMMGADDLDWSELFEKYEETDWDEESEYPLGHYSLTLGIGEDGFSEPNLLVDYYTGG